MGEGVSTSLSSGISSGSYTGDAGTSFPDTGTSVVTASHRRLRFSRPRVWYDLLHGRRTGENGGSRVRHRLCIFHRCIQRPHSSVVLLTD